MEMYTRTHGYVQETPHIAILNKQKWTTGGHGSPPGGGTNGREEDVEKGCRRVNMVPILCTNVCKWKNETC
jgi:hypothetical protein